MQKLQNIYIKYAQNMQKIGREYAKYAINRQKKCKKNEEKYAETMQEICRKYASNMQEICRKYAGNMQINIKNMQKICTICKKYA